MATVGLSWCVLRHFYRCKKLGSISNLVLENRLQSVFPHARSAWSVLHFHSSPALERSNAVRGTKCGGKDIFEHQKIQDTMNKVMGTRGPFKKVAYKPGLRQTSAASAVGKQDFPTIKRGDMQDFGDEERGSQQIAASGHSAGRVRRARQLSDVMFLRIAEMIHSGGIHPIFREHKIEIVKVRMLPDMRNVHIFWSITGNPQIDRVIDEKLRDEAGWEIRRQMAELQIMGRVPSVVFMPDDSRIRATHLYHLIEIADKPPEDEEKDAQSGSLLHAKDSNPIPAAEDPGDDLSQRISAFSFAADAPTWREMKESVVVVRDSRSLNHDHLMGQVLRAKASANTAFVEEWDRRRSEAAAETNASRSWSSWRFNAGEKDELSTYLKGRKKNVERRKIRGAMLDYDERDLEDHEHDDRDDEPYEAESAEDSGR